MTALAGFEEENDVAGVEVCERVEEEIIARLLLLAVELRLFVGVREEAGEVCQKMPVAFAVSFFFFFFPSFCEENIPICDTPRSQHQNPSLRHHPRSQLLLRRAQGLSIFLLILILILFLFLAGSIVGIIDEVLHFKILRILLGLSAPGILDRKSVV